MQMLFRHHPPPVVPLHARLNSLLSRAHRTYRYGSGPMADLHQVLEWLPYWDAAIPSIRRQPQQMQDMGHGGSLRVRVTTTGGIPFEQNIHDRISLGPISQVRQHTHAPTTPHIRQRYEDASSYCSLTPKPNFNPRQMVRPDPSNHAAAISAFS